jgi:hypothetical protein
MPDPRAAWNDAGERLSELGQKLKSHYAQQHGTDSAQATEELADAARRLGGAVQDAFEALGVAAKDKEVQADVKQVGQSLYDALGATFGQVSEELRRSFSAGQGSSRTAPAEAGHEPGAEPEPGAEAEPGAEPEPEPEPEAEPGPDPKIEPWGTP